MGAVLSGGQFVRPVTLRMLGCPRSVFEGEMPSWINCELCERSDVQHQELFTIAEVQAGNDAADSATLMLLCRDCSALAEGAIDQLEWSHKTNRHPVHANPYLSICTW